MGSFSSSTTVVSGSAVSTSVLTVSSITSGTVVTSSVSLTHPEKTSIPEMINDRGNMNRRIKNLLLHVLFLY